MAIACRIGAAFGGLIAVRGFFGTVVEIGVDGIERLYRAIDFIFGAHTCVPRRVRRFGKRGCHTDNRTDSDAATDSNTSDDHG